eukprot:1163925_1
MKYIFLESTFFFFEGMSLLPLSIFSLVIVASDCGEYKFDYYSDCGESFSDCNQCFATYYATRYWYDTNFNPAKKWVSSWTCGWDFVAKECMKPESITHDGTGSCQSTEFYVSQSTVYPDGNYQIKNGKLNPHFCAHTGIEALSKTITNEQLRRANRSIISQASTECTQYTQVYEDLKSETIAGDQSKQEEKEKKSKEATMKTVKTILWIIPIICIGVFCVWCSKKLEKHDGKASGSAHYVPMDQGNYTAPHSAPAPQRPQRDYAAEQRAKEYNDWYAANEAKKERIRRRDEENYYRRQNNLPGYSN